MFQRFHDLKKVKKHWSKESISSTFYVQLLLAQIPEAQKDTDIFNEFLRFWDLHA